MKNKASAPPTVAVQYAGQVPEAETWVQRYARTILELEQVRLPSSGTQDAA